MNIARSTYLVRVKVRKITRRPRKFVVEKAKWVGWASRASARWVASPFVRFGQWSRRTWKLHNPRRAFRALGIAYKQAYWMPIEEFNRRMAQCNTPAEVMELVNRPDVPLAQFGGVNPLTGGDSLITERKW